MADISQVNLPNDNNNPYDIADTTARSGLADKMDKTNPTGTGSFSLNRKADTTIGDYSFAEGYRTTASGYGSHAEGQNTIASSSFSHAEGYGTTASGSYSHSEGCGTTASDSYSHAEGQNTIASSSFSHAEGYSTTASGSFSHTEGYYTTANGTYSHAEGYNTTASGEASHAEGSGTIASGYYSHAEGRGTTANHESQHVMGEYNILDDSTARANTRGNYVEIVGNGTNGSSRSNARTLDWSGNEVLSGTIEASGFGTTLDKEVDRGGVQLTQAQYDALVNAGTVDANTTYFITDANNTTASYAAGVTYDNTDSGLTATNVQDAIDEIAETGGGGGTVVLTQAEYQDLVNEGEVNPNISYYISDANSSTPLYASGVHYDNSDSGLTATDVQSAIDEVVFSTSETLTYDGVSFVFKKRGYFVEIACAHSTTKAYPTTWTSLTGTLPSSYFPSSDLYTFLGFPNGNSINIRLINGTTVQLRANSNDSMYAQGSTIYMI